MKGIELLILTIISALIIISVTTVIALDFRESEYCSANNGTWSRGVCFKNEMLVRLK